MFAPPANILARGSVVRIGVVAVSSLLGTGLCDLRLVQHLHELADLLGTHRHAEEDARFEDDTTQERT